MAEIKLGNKHECQECGTKFYDFGKPEPVCPKCGAALASSQNDSEEE